MLACPTEMCYDMTKEAVIVSDATVTQMSNVVAVPDFMRDCIDIPKFYQCCAKCGNFGKTWSCPPFSFDVGAFWKEFRILRLFARKISPAQDLLERSFSAEELATQYRSLLWPVKADMLQELLALERMTPGSKVLAMGGCDLCGEGGCARLDGEPCRQPERMRPSIESLGGDVGRCLELYFGERLLWAGEGRLPAHFLLLGGLLEK